jgi:hypothetical protein
MSQIPLKIRYKTHLEITTSKANARVTFTTMGSDVTVRLVDTSTTCTVNVYTFPVVNISAETFVSTIKVERLATTLVEEFQHGRNATVQVHPYTRLERRANRFASITSVPSSIEEPNSTLRFKPPMILWKTVRVRC